MVKDANDNLRKTLRVQSLAKDHTISFLNAVKSLAFSFCLYICFVHALYMCSS